MPWARASALDRHLACPASSFLPQWRTGWSKGYLGIADPVPEIDGPVQDTSAADWGTALHDAKSDNDRAIDPWKSALASVRNKYWPPALGIHEKAYAYDCETGYLRCGPNNLPVEDMDKWKNAQATSCVIGTADFVGILPSGALWVDDLKTGWERPEVDTESMLFYAFCHSFSHPSNELPYVQISITHAPRDEDPAVSVANIRRYWMKVTKERLNDFAIRLRQEWRKRKAGLDKSLPGPYCGYCPSASICPSVKPDTVTQLLEKD